MSNTLKFSNDFIIYTLRLQLRPYILSHHFSGRTWLTPLGSCWLLPLQLVAFYVLAMVLFHVSIKLYIVSGWFVSPFSWLLSWAQLRSLSCLMRCAMCFISQWKQHLIPKMNKMIPMYVQMQHIGNFLQFHKQDSGLKLCDKSMRGMIMASTWHLWQWRWQWGRSVSLNKYTWWHYSWWLLLKLIDYYYIILSNT